jgi:hypothetical protein
VSFQELIIFIRSSGDVIYRSPASATVIPFKATSVAPTATFTVAGPVVSDIDYTPNDGDQNTPSGPGASDCLVSFIISREAFSWYRPGG